MAVGICTFKHSAAVLQTWNIPVFTGQLNFSASQNISDISVTLDVFHLSIGWLKDPALANILPIFQTFEEFHSPIGWLNDSALLNIPCISVTFEVFHFPTGWLKDNAPRNIQFADSSIQRASSGLSPYRQCPCRAHEKGQHCGRPEKKLPNFNCLFSR